MEAPQPAAAIPPTTEQDAQVAAAPAPHPPSTANDVASSSSNTVTLCGPPPDAAATTCKWWRKGFCARGATCWFKHGNAERPARLSPEAPVFKPAAAAAPIPPTDATAGPSSDPILTATEEQPPCGICFDESPASYGLLESCNHAFCLTCLREWRKAKKCNTQEEAEAVAAGLNSNTKACPACRQRSHYIIPSSNFHSNGPTKSLVISRYKAVLAAKPCKHFEASKRTARGPFCPFGDECLYGHALTPGDDRYAFGGGFQHMYELSQKDRDARAAREYARQLGRIAANRRRARWPRRRPDNDMLDPDLDIAFTADEETLMAIANAGRGGGWDDPWDTMDADIEGELIDMMDEDEQEQQEGDRELRRMMIDSYGEDLDPRAAEQRAAENRAMARDVNRALGVHRRAAAANNNNETEAAAQRPQSSPRSQRRRAQREYNRQHRANGGNADGVNAQAGPSNGRGPQQPARRIAPLPQTRNNRHRDAFATPAADFDYYDDPTYDDLDFDDGLDDDWDRRHQERIEELYMYGYRFDEDPDEFEDMLYEAGVFDDGYW